MMKEKIKRAIFRLVLVLGVLLGVGTVAASAQGTVTRPPKPPTSSQSGKTSGRQGSKINKSDEKTTNLSFDFRPKVYFNCEVDIFGETGPIIIDEFKREEDFDSFEIVTDINQADLIINLEFKANENGKELVDNTMDYKVSVYASYKEEGSLSGSSQTGTYAIGLSPIGYKEAALTTYRKLKIDFNKRIKNGIKSHIRYAKLMNDSLK